MKTSSLISCLLISITLSGQIKNPPLSAQTTLSKQIGFTTITISYESPSARWRKEEDIFGKTVPFGKLWRTGAGPGTKISFNTKVTIGDKVVAPGIYSLYSIPDKDNWVFILNSDTGAYNVFHHDPAKDVARVNAKPVRSQRYYPSLNFDIDFIPNNASVVVSWINTQVSFPVNTGIDEEITAYIKQNLVTGKVKDYEQYHEGIIYYEWNNGDQNELMKMINNGMELKKERFWYYSKIALLDKQGKFDEGIRVSKEAITLIENSPEEECCKKSDLIADFTTWIKTLEEKKSKK